MSTVSSFLFTAGYVLGAVWELARYALRFGWVMLLPNARLAARLLVAESQLAVELNRSGGSKRRRRRFTPAFRLLWVALSKVLEGWEDLAHLMKPATVKRWHTTAFRLFWRWRSRPGRLPIPSETPQLIRRLSRENPLWGPDRLRDVLFAAGLRGTLCGNDSQVYGEAEEAAVALAHLAPVPAEPSGGLLGDFVHL